MSSSNNNLGKYIFWAIVILLIFASFLIIRPFIIALISAFILAYLARPLHSILSKKINKNLSAILCILIAIIVVLIPISFLLTEIIHQTYSTLQDNDVSKTLSEISSYSLFNKLGINIASLREKAAASSILFISQALREIPTIIAGILITLMGMFYILTNWEYLSKNLKKYIPFKNKDEIAYEIDKTTQTIVYGTLLIALLEFTVAFIGFSISGIGPSLLLAGIIFLFAFIPGLGPIAVWLPLLIYELFVKNYPSAIGVAITGVIISFGIELILLSKVVGDKSRINPLVMLVGVIGGIAVFGIFGFIIGPLILSYTIKLLEEGVENN